MNPFDRFAARSSTLVSRAPFFAFCVALVVVWAPSYFLLHDLNKWQLIINTATTILTFLMIALVQNAQERFERSVHAKLNAIAEYLAGDCSAAELRRAVGVEEQVSA